VDNFLDRGAVKGDAPLSASKKQEVGCKKQDRILKDSNDLLISLVSDFRSLAS
jgi:hypothetical protein